MNEKDLLEVRDRQSLEGLLKRRIHNTVSINVYYSKMSEYWASGRTWYLRFDENAEKIKGEIVSNANSKIFVSGNKKVVVYVSEFNNADILKELDYIQNHYCFAMGTKRNTFISNDCIVMIFNDAEGLKEGKNYASTNKVLLAYDGAFEDKKCVDFVISGEATAEQIADTFENYIKTKGGCFKELLWSKWIDKRIKEFVFVVEHGIPGAYEVKRTIRGTSISGDVIELAYGDEMRIYIGYSKADYVMKTYGESILDGERKVFKMELPNNLIVKIYQKNAPKFNNGQTNNWTDRIFGQI